LIFQVSYLDFHLNSQASGEKKKQSNK